MAWLIGMTPPSAAPISSRAPSSSRKVWAMPVRKEQSEKAMVVRISSSLRLPIASDRRPMPKAANDQVSDRALASRPTWVLVRPKVGLDERHQEVERVAVEEDDAEIEAEQPDQQGLVAGLDDLGFSAAAALLMRTAGSGRGRPSRPRRARSAVKACSMPGRRRDQLDEAGIVGTAVHIGDVAAGRHAGAEGDAVAARLELGDVRFDIVAGAAEMVEAVAAPLDRLAIDAGMIVIGLDQLDLHVAGKGHGDGDVGPGRLAAIDRMIAGEMVEQEPGADLEVADPVSRSPHGCRGRYRPSG